MGCRVSGFGFRVSVSGLGFRVWGSGLFKDTPRIPLGRSMSVCFGFHYLVMGTLLVMQFPINP